jgi:hypothetical protein
MDQTLADHHGRYALLRVGRTAETESAGNLVALLLSGSWRSGLLLSNFRLRWNFYGYCPLVDKKPALFGLAGHSSWLHFRTAPHNHAFCRLLVTTYLEKTVR